MLIVGLGNKARQGKDSIADHLVKDHGFHKFHFADALKKECMEFFGWNEDKKNALAADMIRMDNADLVERNFRVVQGIEDKGNEIRTKPYGIVIPNGSVLPFGRASLLQYWGQFRRALDEDHWVKATFAMITKENAWNRVVMADMRYKNEYEWIKVLGGATIRIVRLDKDGKQMLAKDRDPRHLSEVDLDDVWMPELRVPDGMLNEIGYPEIDVMMAKYGVNPLEGMPNPMKPHVFSEGDGSWRRRKQ